MPDEQKDATTGTPDEDRGEPSDRDGESAEAGAPPEDPSVPHQPDAAEAQAEAAQAPEDRIAALEREKQELWDRLLRTAADFDNFRKRSRRDLAEAADHARDEILREILPAVDNLERALGHAGTERDPDALREGVDLVWRHFLQSLERFDIRPYDSVGARFDPERHEALQQQETDEAEPGTVLREFQRGYRQGDRVIRPAMVVVARAKAVEPARVEAAEETTAQTEPAPEGGDETADTEGDAEE